MDPIGSPLLNLRAPLNGEFFVSVALLLLIFLNWVGTFGLVDEDYPAKPGGHLNSS